MAGNCACGLIYLVSLGKCGPGFWFGVWGFATAFSSLQSGLTALPVAQQLIEAKTLPTAAPGLCLYLSNPLNFEIITRA